MTVYYSCTGGIFSRHLFTFDLNNFSSRTGEHVEQGELTNTFKAEANTVLTKLNYLHILNKYHLFNRLTNV